LLVTINYCGDGDVTDIVDWLCNEDGQFSLAECKLLQGKPLYVMHDVRSYIKLQY